MRGGWCSPYILVLHYVELFFQSIVNIAAASTIYPVAKSKVQRTSVEREKETVCIYVCRPFFALHFPPPYIHTKPSLLVCSYSSIFIHAMRSILDVRHSEKKKKKRVKLRMRCMGFDRCQRHGGTLKQT